MFEGQTLATVMSNVALYKPSVGPVRFFCTVFSTVPAFPLWCFNHGRWIFVADGELESRISLEVHDGHWQANLSLQPLMVIGVL